MSVDSSLDREELSFILFYFILCFHLEEWGTTSTSVSSYIGHDHLAMVVVVRETFFAERGAVELKGGKEGGR